MRDLQKGTTMYVIQRTPQLPSVLGSFKYLDGARYFSHHVGEDPCEGIHWTAAPWHATVYATEEEARQSPGMSWQCRIVTLAAASAEAMSRRE
jgi:hypothetical protein